MEEEGSQSGWMKNRKRIEKEKGNKEGKGENKKRGGKKERDKRDEKCHCGRMDGKHIEGSMKRLSSVTAQENARRNVGKEAKKKTRQGREDII